MKPQFYCTLLFLLISPFGYAQQLLLEGNLEAWSAQAHKGHTLYQPMMDMEQGVVIQAISHNSASSLRYSKEINLTATPILKWQWTAQQLPFALKVGEDGIERRLTQFDETQSSGDDFVLRMSVGQEPLFGSAKTLHYVWSANEPIGSHWSIGRHTRVLVISGEQQPLMQWQTPMRHVQADWLEVFGEKIESLDFVEIMTDSDAIQGQAIGYYGDMQMLAGRRLVSE